MSNLFRFKQFSISQERSSMKVGTDGLLLGAWTGLDKHPETILDIGSGTGLIALMLAQRSEALQIDAIEPDPDSYEECVENFEASPWADRLFCYHATLEEFSEEVPETYDLIVSNPPFYTETSIPGGENQLKAKHSISLPFEDLLQASENLLSDNGSFAVILPFKETRHFTELAADIGLFPSRITSIRSRPDRDFIRSLMEFQRSSKDIQQQVLTVEDSPGIYSQAYTDLTRDFYMKM
ncbi:tRNA1(Val) (adenine(37)-N6)-methyltransferase [Poritiphilus flavus]|uniref:tRNA1(Val) (adenine(37)-N6)-methyltransferase n=1 Tax=Poritiphilus flavus TaxID=2697053 RepID=A0A6L9E7T2_9FLAO|nr:methyltransferase [Poritiphilus flavus]NAS10509.1 methyltransferase [Poritiphilus flavus]